ncbi:MAG TPA: DUF2291 domain-containing protein [Anaerolineales bacterium]|jgi:predicted lipoprotein
MNQKTFPFVVALVLLVVLGLMARYGFTVVKIQDAEAAIQSEKFDPVSYVDGIWSTKLIPAFNEKAVDLSTILSEMKPDANGNVPKDSLVAVAKKYGLITVGEAHVYIVKGVGRVVAVDTSTSLGTAELAITGYEGPIKVLLYVGSRIPSDETSVRDAVGFINFGNFKEQTEYGKVSAEINKRVLNQVLGGLDKEKLMGKTLTFKGAFNIRTFNLVQINLKDIKIVPIAIELGE